MKTTLIFFLLLLVCSLAQSQALTKEEIVQVNLSANSFLSLVAEYSKCNGNNSGNLESQILSAKDDFDPTNFFCNDLFSEITGDYEDNLNWLQYLRYVEDYFKFSINVDNENNKVLNCRLSTNGGSYALYEVDKILKYQSKSSIQKIIVVINLKSFKVKEIVSPAFFKKNNSLCNAGDAENDDVLRGLRKQAEEYFNQKDYVNASNLYNVIVEKDVTDLLAKSRYEECRRRVSYLDLLGKADGDYINKKFEVAKNEYNNILNEYEEADTSLIKQRIEQCSEGIKEQTFKKNIELGDYYFQIANFEEARNYYYAALKIKPKDNKVIGKLEKSKHADKSFVLGEIQRAVDMAEKSRRNLGEAFQILAKYEPSGLLKTPNYIFLTLMMDEKNADVKRLMKYNNRTCLNYLHIYTKKLYDTAGKEYDIDWKSRAQRVLERVINERFQK